MNIIHVKVAKMFCAISCLLMLAACGSSDNTTQLASWDNMYYYDVDMPQQ